MRGNFLKSMLVVFVLFGLFLLPDLAFSQETPLRIGAISTWGKAKLGNGHYDAQDGLWFSPTGSDTADAMGINFQYMTAPATCGKIIVVSENSRRLSQVRSKLFKFVYNGETIQSNAHKHPEDPNFVRIVDLRFEYNLPVALKKGDEINRITFTFWRATITDPGPAGDRLTFRMYCAQ